MKEDLCCFGRSIAVIHRYMAAFASAELKNEELTYGFALFIWHIGNHPGCSQKDLCAYFVIDKTTTAKNIKKLEKMDLIYRERNEKDHRFNHIYLTDQGQRVFKRVETVFGKMADILKGGMTESQEEQARVFLESMEENMCQAFNENNPD